MRFDRFNHTRCQSHRRALAATVCATASAAASHAGAGTPVATHRLADAQQAPTTATLSILAGSPASMPQTQPAILASFMSDTPHHLNDPSPRWLGLPTPPASVRTNTLHRDEALPNAASGRAAFRSSELHTGTGTDHHIIFGYAAVRSTTAPVVVHHALDAAAANRPLRFGSEAVRPGTLSIFIPSSGTASLAGLGLILAVGKRRR